MLSSLWSLLPLVIIIILTRIKNSILFRRKSAYELIYSFYIISFVTCRGFYEIIPMLVKKSLLKRSFQIAAVV